MKKSTQDNNVISISTPFGKDAIILNAFDYSERISAPFSLTAKGFFDGTQGELNTLVGKEVTVQLEQEEGISSSPRYFHGYVQSATLLGSRLNRSNKSEKYKNIALEIRSKLSFLSYRKNCRIFQDKSVIEVVSILLAEHGVEHNWYTSNEYVKHTYKVQYNETDLEFVERIMAEEGLSYCFTHQSQSHILDIFDGVTYLQTLSNPLVNFDTGSTQDSHISHWHEAQQLVTHSSHARGYDVLRPLSFPHASRPGTTGYNAVPNSEYYEYFGETVPESQLTQKNARSIESLQQYAYECSGVSSCREFEAGKKFGFRHHEDKTREGKFYILTSVSVQARIKNQLGSSDDEESGIHIGFTCVEDGTPIRSFPYIDKPHISGIQTAIVTGNELDEIYVDEHGRIKIQFHWDREGRFDANTSCWVRVAQSIAGNAWGAVFTPRVGQEVIVDFVNGDPDQPIVTGALYNGSQPPPYSLPENKTMSGFKTRSVQEASDDFNELRFEDKPGEEHIYLHAQKDYLMHVEDSAEWMVESDKEESVGNTYTIKVGDTFKLEAGFNIEIVVGGASISMSSSGDISIKGANVSIDGSSIKLKAGKISLN